MNPTRRSFISSTAGAAVAGCGRARREVAAVLRVGVPITPTAAPFYVAFEQGYFREAGLQVEPVEVSQSGAQAQLLASGQLDACFMAPSPALFSAVNRGADLKAVCGRDAVLSSCSYGGDIIARQAAFPAGLADLRQLRGKKIAFTNAGSFTEFALDTILDSAGVKRDQIEGLALRQAESMAALAAGKIDGVISVGHVVGARFPEGVAVYPGLSRFRDGYMLSFVFAGARLRLAERALGVRFLRAYLRGARDFAAGHTPAALAMLAKKTGLELDSAVKACRTSTRTDGAIDRPSLDLFAQWTLRKRYVDALPPLDALVDGTLLGEARS